MAPRILVIRGGAIGDFILTLPAIRLLRENFPAARLEILGYKHIVALAEGRFYADASRSIEYGALSGFFVPNGELAADLVEYFAGFQQVVSYLYDPDGFFEKNIRKCGVKHFLHVSPKLNDAAHAAQQLAQPLQSLALYLEDPAPTLHPNADDHAFATAFLSGAIAKRDVPWTGPLSPSSTTPERLLAVHPGSGSERKNWPIEHWLDLGDWLAALEPRPSVLLIGGEADRANLATIERGWKKLSLTTAQDLPLPRLAAIVERCALFIGHDSGISHLAAAAGTPCVLLFGPTDHQVWAPANRGVVVVEAPDGNLAALSPAPVRAAILQQLGADDAPLLSVILRGLNTRAA